MALMLALTYGKISTGIGKEVKTGQLNAEDSAGEFVGSREKLRSVQVNHELGPGLARLWVIEG